MAAKLKGAEDIGVSRKRSSQHVGYLEVGNIQVPFRLTKLDVLIDPITGLSKGLSVKLVCALAELNIFIHNDSHSQVLHLLWEAPGCLLVQRPSFAVPWPWLKQRPASSNWHRQIYRMPCASAGMCYCLPAAAHHSLHTACMERGCRAPTSSCKRTASKWLAATCCWC